MIQKYSGAGNTFIIINNLDGRISERRQFVLDVMKDEGEGMDGVIFVERSDTADFRMNYFNKDGTGDALCGNGLRCTAKYISDNALSDKKEMTLEAVSKIFESSFSEDETIKISFPPPELVKLNFKLKVHFEDWWELLNCSYVDVGSPHIVVFIDEIEKPKITQLQDVKIIDWGRNIRMHKDLMPEGANVNFVKVDDAEKGLLSIRSYERGVEGETLACGTGAISSAIVFYALRAQVLPVKLVTRSDETLTVDLDIQDRRIRKVYLSGNAVRMK
jgi:diaminopimelate epimerase